MVPTMTRMLAVLRLLLSLLPLRAKPRRIPAPRLLLTILASLLVACGTSAPVGAGSPPVPASPLAAPTSAVSRPTIPAAAPTNTQRPVASPTVPRKPASDQFPDYLPPPGTPERRMYVDCKRSNTLDYDINPDPFGSITCTLPWDNTTPYPPPPQTPTNCWATDYFPGEAIGFITCVNATPSGRGIMWMGCHAYQGLRMIVCNRHFQPR